VQGKPLQFVQAALHLVLMLTEKQEILVMYGLLAVQCVLVQVAVAQVVENVSLVSAVATVDVLNNYVEAILGRLVSAVLLVVLKDLHTAQDHHISLCRQHHLHRECQDQPKTVAVGSAVVAVMVDMLYSQEAAEQVHFLTQADHSAVQLGQVA
jgi:hypothetical protein